MYLPHMTCTWDEWRGGGGEYEGVDEGKMEGMHSLRRRIHACHMRRRIHACHMRRRIQDEGKMEGLHSLLHSLLHTVGFFF
jgi:phage-related protein